MKKIFYILPVFLILGLTLPVYAVTNNQTNTQTREQVQQQNQNQQVSVSPTGNQVQNRNQINTQNQGEDSKLQVNTQEQENLETGEGLQNRNQNAIQNMSQVAKQVQLLLKLRTEGGIGEQVRQIAREQSQAQQKTQEQLNKLESRGKLLRLLVGPDYGAIKNLKQQLEQNQLRIRQLEQLQNQLSNQADITTLQEAIQALNKQHTSLQERITAEEQTRSLFGWLFRLFVR